MTEKEESKHETDPTFSIETLDEALKRVKGEGFVRFYANNMLVTFSQWDMKLTFGEVIDQPGGASCVEDRATVVMSLQHAKVIIEILVRNFAALEKQFGKINLLLGV